MKETDIIEIADFIRSKSRAGELASSEELEAEAGVSAEIRPLSSVFRAPFGHDDIKAVHDDTGKCFYYSERFITSSYASLLALRSDPLRMMAEVIREHSRIYPRPVPVTLFQFSPFNLAEELVALGLKEMNQNAPYLDIAQVTTSIGNVFVYSTDYLDRDYAAMLAEWADVGQVENP